MYTPGIVPSDAKDIPAFLSDELLALSKQIGLAQQFILLDPQYVAPKKLREGMVVLADGVTWNPGAGAG